VVSLIQPVAHSSAQERLCWNNSVYYPNYGSHVDFSRKRIEIKLSISDGMDYFVNVEWRQQDCLASASDLVAEETWNSTHLIAGNGETNFPLKRKLWDWKPWGGCWGGVWPIETLSAVVAAVKVCCSTAFVAAVWTTNEVAALYWCISFLTEHTCNTAALKTFSD